MSIGDPQHLRQIHQQQQIATQKQKQEQGWAQQHAWHAWGQQFDWTVLCVYVLSFVHTFDTILKSTRSVERIFKSIIHTKPIRNNELFCQIASNLLPKPKSCTMLKMSNWRFLGSLIKSPWLKKNSWYQFIVSNLSLFTPSSSLIEIILRRP